MSEEKQVSKMEVPFQLQETELHVVTKDPLGLVGKKGWAIAR